MTARRRQAARVDDNQAEIIKALRRLPGVSVEDGHDDIIVGIGGRSYWYEIKRPEAISKRTGKVKDSELTPSERRRLDTFTGHYKIISTAEEIITDLFGVDRFNDINKLLHKGD